MGDVGAIELLDRPLDEPVPSGELSWRQSVAVRLRVQIVESRLILLIG